MGKFFAVIVLIVSVLATVSAVSSTEAARVMVGFDGEMDEDVVSKYGEVIGSYSSLGVIVAQIPEDMIDDLEDERGVSYVEKDRIAKLSDDELPPGVDRIDAEVTWSGSDKGTDASLVAGNGVSIAVIDSGIDYDHPDLMEAYIGGYDFVNDDSDPKDDNGHGTHVAGIIAASDDGKGIIGVAPKSSIYALKALDAKGKGKYSNIVAGIDWAIKHDADIITMSLSGKKSKALGDAVQKAYDSGIVVIAAAGNKGDGDASTDEVAYPAAYGTVIAVGAARVDGRIGKFSNSGKYLELAAPGVSVYSTMPTYDCSKTDSGKYTKEYAKMSGTSMAAPHVAGVAALIISNGVKDSDGDGIINDDVRRILQENAQDLGQEGRDKESGFGMVDASRLS